MAAWHTLPLQEVEKALATSLHAGLAKTDAVHRLEEYGRNQLPEGKRDSYASIIIRQFTSPLIYVLLIAAVVVWFLDEISDAVIIIVVLILNAIVGAIQEGKAQNTLVALKKFAETNTTVLREGVELIIPDTEAVPGDIVILREGEKVPADIRVTESHALCIDEAALTGESVPVHKTTEALEDPALAVSAQKNMVFKGTTVLSGSGKGIIVATALETHIGTISKAVSAHETEIPLQKDVRQLSRVIIAVVLGTVGLIFVLGLAYGKSVREMFATAVSLAVSAIPEGLPVVLTLVLATGVWRMARRNALVKKLQAVEALGAARIIAVDKTGTLTKNEMVVREVIAGGKTFAIEGSGYAPAGEVKLRGKKCAIENHPELKLAAKVAALAASAQAIFIEEQGIWKVSGDPTEAALAVFAKKLGVLKEDIAPENAIVADVPFDYKTKYRTLAIREEKILFTAIAGAPEVLLKLASRELRDGKHVKLTADRRQELIAEFSEISQRGLRVVGFGYIEKPLTRKEAASGDITEMTIAGFFAMEDALREEVPEAMRRAHEAGIRVVMITGDYKLTAMAIAKEAGILKDKDRVVTGDELAALDEKGLASIIHEVTVFARVTPEDKLKIVQAYRAAGLTIAMTGDGVNDAPSLVAADLGVAMGKIGTEVSKEAADIVLLDDNFGSIVAAVEEGRSIFKTIKKVLLYLFSTSMGEVLALAGAIVLNVPLPILPRQILWLNLVTDGFLTVALAMEPKEKDLLRGKFVKPNRYLIDKDMVVRSIIMSGVMMAGALYLFKDYYQTDLVKAQTIALCVLAVYQWFNAWNCRSDRDSIALQNPFSNWWLIVATAIVVALQFAATTVPILQDTLQLVPLTLYEWVMVVLVALTIVIAEEIRKLVVRLIRERDGARAAS